MNAKSNIGRVERRTEQLSVLPSVVAGTSVEGRRQFELLAALQIVFFNFQLASYNRIKCDSILKMRVKATHPLVESTRRRRSIQC